MLGILLRRDYQRKGLGSEAIRAFLEVSFEGLGMHRVMTAIDAENEASRKLWLKVGMRCEGHFLQDRLRNGQWIDTEYYAILRSEYYKPNQVGISDP
jgi:RimJ/RimL family protein N-acetyltransferase